MRLLAALAIIGSLCLGGVMADDPPKADKPADDPFFVLFKTAGRKWNLKRVPKAGNPGGDVDTSYHYYEIAAVTAEYAELGECTLMQPAGDPYDDLAVGRVKFDKKESAFNPPKGFTKVATEKLKCNAGTFDCTKWQDAAGSTQWRSTAFPGLVVKWDDPYGTRELNQFEMIEGDPGYQAPKVKTRKPHADKEEDPARLFKKKGRTWTMKTTNYSGPINKRIKAYELAHHEVNSVSDTEATVEVSRMTLMKEKMRGAEPVKKTVTFADIEDHTRPSPRAAVDHTERRKLTDRIYTCKVYKFKDDQSRDVIEWYADEWPGLVVRRQVNGEPLNRLAQIAELIEFNE